MLIYLQILDTEEERSKFELLYMEYRGLMYHVAYGILQNEQDAEDATHQAFLRIAENMGRIADVKCSKTKSLLVTITENIAIDMYRYQARHKGVPLDDNTVPLQVEYTNLFAVTQSFLMLSPRYQGVLNLKYVHGFSNKEIAQILGLSEGTAIKLIQRAKNKLQNLCEEEDIL